MLNPGGNVPITLGSSGPNESHPRSGQPEPGHARVPRRPIIRNRGSVMNRLYLAAPVLALALLSGCGPEVKYVQSDPTVLTPKPEGYDGSCATVLNQVFPSLKLMYL